MLLPWLAFILTLRVTQSRIDDIEECTDKSPYCNTNDCTVRPGYALEYCKKTCGDCEPFCHNSHFVSCKETRKPECDSMLKDYCPLLCGACRPIKKKSSKGTGIKTPRTPLSVANLGILKKFATSKLQTVDRTSSIIPATTGSAPTLRNKPSEEISSVFRSPPNGEVIYPDPFLESEAPTSLPITSDDDYSETIEEPIVDSNKAVLNETLANHVFPEPEPIRIPPNPPPNHRPPARWRRPTNRPPTRGTSWSSTQMQAERRYHPTHPPSQWLLPYPQNPQPYPVLQFASPPKFYNPGFYAQHFPVSASMDSIQEPPMAFGDLITLLGCHDRDPPTCSKITGESCLSRPGYYMKLCPVKCKNCSGLQCHDSIKIDCIEVERLGGCKLPAAAEYCPRTCRLCSVPSVIADSLPPCKDELETCENLAESGVCEHPYSRKALRIYCAKSCGFCRQPQYYMNEAPYQRLPKEKQRSQKGRNPLG